MKHTLFLIALLFAACAVQQPVGVIQAQPQTVENEELLLTPEEKVEFKLWLKQKALAALKAEWDKALTMPEYAKIAEMDRQATQIAQDIAALNARLLQLKKEKEGKKDGN